LKWDPYLIKQTPRALFNMPEKRTIKDVLGNNFKIDFSKSELWNPMDDLSFLEDVGERKPRVYFYNVCLDCAPEVGQGRLWDFCRVCGKWNEDEKTRQGIVSKKK